MSQSLSEADIHQLVQLLDKCQPGDLPPSVFEKVGKVAVYPAIELVPLRRKGDHVEVLLLRRPPDDITWPNMWHTPGTILRPTDQSLLGAMRRLISDELPGVEMSQPQFIGNHLLTTRRGKGLTIEFIATSTSSCPVGRFYDTQHLPDDLNDHQFELVERATEAFLSTEHT